MTTATLRRSGGSLIIAIPAAFAAQNQLQAGCELECTIVDNALVVKPLKKKSKLSDLIADTPKEARVESWDELAPAGVESW
ncbi:antitoxin MazE [Azomonas agilis]|uniref:Antitoxin MazE n=1 Tax=Azomonas agilis TaxID=116849 RepID=A0A562J2Y2_9GAMM|nr:AbrB/MazE/SpoVT family DNA-binding domain-containing protein [Azomonas agilis]TWH77165.1 antitoxin MazE [Azomonas agilis]